MDHRRREEFPAISNYTGESRMGKLSIFIDESGDFGEIKERPAYYLVTFVFHDQNKSIDKQVLKLEESVRTGGFDVEYIHTGPVIRREEIFAGYSIDERRKLLYKMLNFVNACPVSYLTVVVDRKEASDKVSLSGRLARAINTAIDRHQDFLQVLTRSPSITITGRANSALF